MQEIRAHFDGQVFVPDEPVSLPPDCEVTVVVRPTGKHPLRELEKIADSYPRVPGWPADGAKEVDHYLYGQPKRRGTVTFLDTSYLIALACHDDALHMRAKAWNAVIVPPLLTTDYVILEFVNYLSEPYRRSVAQGMAAWLRTSPDVTLLRAEESLFDAGFQRHAERPDKSWSLTDCISFVVMERARCNRALTYDHHFEQAGFECCSDATRLETRSNLNGGLRCNPTRLSPKSA